MLLFLRAAAKGATRVVLPTPCMPLRPMMRGRLGDLERCVWRCSVMKGMHIGALSSVKVDILRYIGLFCVRRQGNEL